MYGFFGVYMKNSIYSSRHQLLVYAHPYAGMAERRMNLSQAFFPTPA
jgi:hypothetical protein